MDWQPIETAPRDGTHIALAYEPRTKIGLGWDGAVEGYYRLDRTWFPLMNPTHWQLLPPAPHHPFIGGEMNRHIDLAMHGVLILIGAPVFFVCAILGAPLLLIGWCTGWIAEKFGFPA